MKDYVKQIYNEGLATTFYLKPIKYINKKVKNKQISKIISFLIKLLYTVFIILFAVFMFIKKWPL